MSTPLMYVFAFFSGAAALIYQVAWTRILSMTFGSSVLAASAVVAGFMGGMGIGAWLYHRVGDRAKSSVRAYGLLELGIAVSAALLTFVYLWIPQFFAASVAYVPTGTPMAIFRVLSVFVLLLVPSVLMGATYPALCRTLIHSADDADHRLGWIYGLNTLGAAAGALLAGFVLIEFVGSRLSVLVANGINVAIGIAALMLARRSQDTPDPAGNDQDDALESGLPHWLTATVLFGSGFATLAYEMVWFRTLHYTMGPGTYVLTSMLVIFLLGLGLGSFLYRPALRFGRPEWNIGFIQLGIAGFSIIAMGAVQYILGSEELSIELTAMGPAVNTKTWQMQLLTGWGVSIALLLPATLWMGLSFPLANRLFLGSVKNLTSRLGLAYLFSNLGSITGAILAAIWILPSLGTIGGTKLVVAVNIGLGLLVLIRASDIKIRVIGGVLAVALLLLTTALPSRLAFYVPEIRANSKGIELLFEEESDLGNVQVYKNTRRSDTQAMAIDGMIIAVTERWNPSLYAKQILLAHLPMSLDRNIKHTLNLGMASGGTLAALGTYPWVESLDVVEINRSVVRAAKHFESAEVLSDPRAELAVEDALHYLLSTPKRYDLILNDAKEHPRYGGTARVLSSELYQYSLDRLAPCGMFAQRVLLNHTNNMLTMILRSFRSVFPEVEVFMQNPSEVMMIGSDCPIPGRTRPTLSEMRSTGTTGEVKKYFLREATDLHSYWVLSGGDLDRQIPDGPINSWDKLPVEFLSFRQVWTFEDWRSNIELLLPHAKDGPNPETPFGPNRAYRITNRLNHAVHKWVVEDDTDAATAIFSEMIEENPKELRIQSTVKLVRGVFDMFGG